MNKFLKLPLTYTTAVFDDERFVKVRVKVMHNGLNLNNSTFSDDAIEKAAPTLSNIPLLAFTRRVDGEDNADFKGHEFEFKSTEEGIKYIYLGRPIGMIPETNNYTYEEAEDGRKFVNVDGYIWKDYANEALDIVQRDGGKKVSMEIKVNSYSDTHSAIDITDYKYTGIVMLGEDVSEAMMGARADVQAFSFDGIGAFVAKFSADLKDALEMSAENSPLSGEPANPIADPAPTNEPAPSPLGEQSDPLAEPETPPVEVPVEPTEEPAAPAEDPEVNPEPEAPAEEPVPEPVKEEEEPIGHPIPKDEEKSFSELLAEMNALKVEMDQLKMELGNLQVENGELKSFKHNIEKAEFTEKLGTLLEDFSDLEEEVINEVITNNSNLDDIELRLFALRGKKISKAPAKHTKTFTIFDSLIQKENSNEPSWTALVEKYHKTTEGGK